MTIKNKAMAAVTCGLSLAMTLGGPLSALPAYAATVTINQDQAGAEVQNRVFNAYKLATYTTTDEGNVYTFVNDDVRSAVRTVLGELGVDLSGVTTDISLAGKIKDLTSSKQVEFAARIAAAVSGKVTPTTINGNSGNLDNNAYYVVTEDTENAYVVKATPFLLEVGGDDKTVTLKSSQPNIDKDIVSAGAQDTKYDDTSIGSDVAFELNDMTVPNTYGYDTFTYNITDQMSSGLTLTKAQLDGMTLTIGGSSVTASKDTYTVYVVENGAETPVSELSSDWSAKGATFVIKFNKTYFIGTYGSTAKDYTQNPVAGSDIKVNFSATLNEDATVATPEQNKTKLTYSNTPNTNTDSTEHTVYVYTFGVEVQKTFSDNKDLFDQVEFGITGGANGTIWVTGNNGAYTVVKEGTEGAQNASSGLKLDANGHFQIKGLDQGTYTVTETKIPDGYKSNGPQTIKITPDYGTDGSKGKAGEVITLADDKDSDGYVDGAMVNTPNAFHLPETGEVGMIPLPAAGLGIMGAVFVVSSKKDGKNNA